MIVGLTGKFAAGKGTVAELLKTQGFAYHSLSDVIREELKARGLAESREHLIETGNALRREGGPAALAMRILPRLGDGRPHIVDSIRNPAEVEVLRQAPGFFLLGVDADQRVRFQRLVARDRQGDPTTFEQFAALEERETSSTDPTTQQLRATWELADVLVSNDTTVPDLEAAVMAIIISRGWQRR
ncbi:MAG: AAA family ATPase [Myxococcota bacterium]